MKKANNFIGILFIALSLQACTKKLNAEQYLIWCQQEENGLRVSKEMFPFVFTLQYKSPEYIMAVNQKNETTTTQQQQQLMFNFLIKAMDGKTNPVMSSSNGQNTYEIIERFNNNGNEDFKLIIAKDTFDCSFCHLEYNYGVAPLNTVVLSFEVPQLPETYYQHDWLLQYDDKVFNTGLISIKIKQKHLQTLNSVKLI